MTRTVPGIKSLWERLLPRFHLNERRAETSQTLVYQEFGMFFDERRSHFLKIVCQRRQGLSVDSFLRHYRLLDQAGKAAQARRGLLLEKLLTVKRNQFLSKSPATTSLYKKSIVEEILRPKQETPHHTLLCLERRMFLARHEAFT